MKKTKQRKMNQTKCSCGCHCWNSDGICDYCRHEMGIDQDYPTEDYIDDYEGDDNE